MGDLIAIALILIVIMLAVALLGHGLWLMLAAMFGGGRKKCPTCGNPLAGDVCKICASTPQGTDPLEITRRQIEGMFRAGQIEEPVFDQVMAAIEARRGAASVPPPIPQQPVPTAQAVEFVPVAEVVLDPQLPEPKLVPIAVPAVPAPPPPPPLPRIPRKPMTQIMAAFMEAGNIRWGELVGGMLIVGCSIALVLSLWSQIAHQPVLKFLIFNLVTAGFFALGLYSHHRWRLPLTSRGILVTAALLLPLTFLASAAFSHGGRGGGPAMIGQAVSLLLFAVLLWLAGRVIATHDPAPLVVGVLGPSSVILAIRYLAPDVAEMSGRQLLALAALALAFYEISQGWMLIRAVGWKDLNVAECNLIFLMLGITSFSTALPLGLLIYKAGFSVETFRTLAPLCGFAALPALAEGMFLWARLELPELSLKRTTGTAVAAAGAGILAAGIVLSWPAPPQMLAVSLTDGAILAAIAFFFDFPAANLPAGLCLMMGYLLAFDARFSSLSWNGGAPQVIGALLGARSGLGAIPFFAGAAAIGYALWLKGRREQARYILMVAVVAASFSTAVVTRDAYFLPHAGPAAMWVYAFYALIAAGAALQIKNRPLGWAMWLLLLGALQRWMAPRLGWDDSWLMALLVEATIAAIVSVACRAAKSGEALRASAIVVALAASSAALVPLGLRLSMQNCQWEAWRVLWISLIWASQWAVNRSSTLFGAVQAALTTAALLAVAAHLPVNRIPMSWEAWQYYAIAGAALGLVWSVARLLASRWLPAEIWSVDRVVTCGAIVVLVALAVSACLPGIMAEFATSPQFQVGGVAANGPSWLLLALLAVSLSVELWANLTPVWLSALVIVLLAICPLAAAPWNSQHATASALRWIAAVFLLVASVPFWSAKKLAPRLRDPLSLGTKIILAASAACILFLTFYPAILTLNGQHPAGPAADEFFARVGNSVSYLVPLAILILSLIGFAIAERSERYAFSAGLVLNLAVTLGYLLGSIGHISIAMVLQRNIVAAALFAAGWKFACRLGRVERSPRLLLVYCWIATTMLICLILPGYFNLLANPSGAEFPPGLARAIAPLSVLLAVPIFFWLARPQTGMPGSVCGLFALAVIAPQAIPGMPPWGRYHALLAAQVAAAWLTLAAGWRMLQFRRRVQSVATEIPPAAAGQPAQVVLNYQAPVLSDGFGPQRRSAAHLAMTMGLWAVLLAFGTVLSDPLRPWPASATMLAVALLAVLLAAWLPSGLYFYAAAPLLNISVSLWWLHVHGLWSGGSLVDFANVNVITLAVGSVAWLLLELWILRPRGAAEYPSFHNVAAVLCVGAIFALAAGDLLLNPIGLNPTVWIRWAALAATAGLSVACLWDPRMRGAWPCLYFLGIAAILQILGQFHLSGQPLITRGGTLLAAYALATSGLFRSRPSAAIARWLVPANLCLAAIIFAAACWSDFQLPGLSARLAIATAAILQGASIALLARGVPAMRPTSLVIALLGAITWAWAWLAPLPNLAPLNWLAAAMTVTVAMTALYGAGLTAVLRQGGPWSAAVQRILPALIAAGLALLLATLGYEFALRLSSATIPMAWPAMIAVTAALLLAVAAAIVLALSPRRDPLHLSPRGRSGYVYAGEALLAVTFVHVRLTVPWLFSDLLEPFWPLLVIAIAFGGIGLSEFFRRGGQRVLSDPLEKTGAFLPLLPALGFWAVHSSVNYSLLLLLAGVLYSTLAVMRKSFGMGLLAALAANGALWFRLQHLEGFGLLQHPQCWLIPAALSVVAAAYLNRSRLTEIQMRAIHYSCLMCIYVSSTADMFINGVARSPGLALVLGGLSVAGVMAGIMFRIRSFLLLGTSFLFLTLVTIIWHACVDLHQTWLIWVTGIVLGLGIILLFALFEKKRTQVLTVVENLKEWRG
ncbi:MAG TPA: hypothetical protein VMD30_13735 [Tepidisphaeraceae bacterium]|nr:hypothetical protein [Tepidisphaeraceae bacterium]